MKRCFAALGLHVRYGWQFPHAIERKVLERHLRAGRPVECIFDVGANIGQSALALARDFPDARVHAFEPFARIFQVLADNVQGEARIHVHNLALGATIGTLDVAFDGLVSSQTNSLKPRTMEADRTHNREAIQMSTVDEMARAHSIERIDILKTDTEGWDLEVLKGAERMLREGRIQTVVIEAGFLEDRQHTPFAAAYEYLAKFGFRIAGVYEATYFPDGRCDYCNVVYRLG